MQFEVVDALAMPVPKAWEKGWLVHDGWDDWGYRTLFNLVVDMPEGHRHEIGYVKIAQNPMPPGGRVQLPNRFGSLPDGYFSLGQDESYYTGLRALPDSLGEQVLLALRDLALDEELFDVVVGEDVVRRSLLRQVKPETVKGQFRRITGGGARLKPYDFSYMSAPGHPRWFDYELGFKVEPNSNPPSNVHVVIGGNGTGKTTLLQHVSSSFLGHGPGRLVAREGNEASFTNLVSVSFSAFDPFAAAFAARNSRYVYVGIHPHPESAETSALPLSGEEFGRSFMEISWGVQLDRWRKAIRVLQEADPVLAGHDILSLSRLDTTDTIAAEDLQNQASLLYSRLSSGHKIVVLTVTRLVETIAEQSLVLIDEPETHLHPPLLSAFVRCLSELLVQRNAVAIVATHSPVVLQEVPRGCVWKLRRNGDLLKPDRPTIETYGENVGTLTHEVFGLEVTHSGFHRELRRAVTECRSYEEVLARFGDQLGGEARALVRILLATRNAPDVN
ncbi:AAA family ATPase [Kitasatospora sp. NPDC004240]